MQVAGRQVHDTHSNGQESLMQDELWSPIMHWPPPEEVPERTELFLVVDIDLVYSTTSNHDFTITCTLPVIDNRHLLDGHYCN